MAQVIDSKTEEHSFGTLIKEKVITTLTLVYNGSKTNYDIYYDVKFSGVKSGHISGGPVSVSGNGKNIVNPDPEVIVVVSQFNNDIPNNYISMNIVITVDIPFIGLETIYDQTLGGKYNPNLNGWQVALSELQIELGNALRWCVYGNYIHFENKLKIRMCRIRLSF